MSIFCKHEWKVVSEAVTESKFQHAMKSIDESSASGSVRIPWQMTDAERKHIQVIACDKCGKLKRFVESI